MTFKRFSSQETKGIKNAKFDAEFKTRVFTQKIVDRKGNKMCSFATFAITVGKQ